MPNCKFTKTTLSHILLHLFFLHFFRMHHNYFFRRGFENVQTHLFQRKYHQQVVLLVICPLYDSCRTAFMLNMAFDVVLSLSFLQYKAVKRKLSPLKLPPSPNKLLPWVRVMVRVSVRSNLPGAIFRVPYKAFEEYPSFCSACMF